MTITSPAPSAKPDEDDTIYFNEEFKFAAITEEIVGAQKRGQPVLVGTVSIDMSEKLSNYLTRKGDIPAALALAGTIETPEDRLNAIEVMAYALEKGNKIR